MKAKNISKASILLILIVFVTNIVALFNVLKKDDFGKTDVISFLKKDVLDIKSDLSKHVTLGYVTKGAMSFDDLAKYYQLRFLFAPANLSLNYSNNDTLVYYNGYKRQEDDRSELLIVEDFELIKKSQNNLIYIFHK